MTDIVDPVTRGRMMSGIRGRNTAPELMVRSALHRAGLRFRIHQRRLAGTPDIALPKWNAVVFVHGCFWHRHEGCRYAYLPRSNRRFWMAKFRATVARDRRKASALRRSGWRVFTIWECQLTESRLHRVILRITGANERARR